MYGKFGEDSEGIAWEIFLTRLYEYNPASTRSFPGWIKSKLFYGFLDKLREDNEKKKVDCLSMNEISHSFVDPTNPYQSSDEMAVLYQAMGKLRPLHQKVLLAHLYPTVENLNIVSQGRSKQALNKILQRARTNLRKFLT